MPQCTKFRSGEISISIIDYQLFCRIDICDNGIGISEEEISKIFLWFYRSAAVSETQGVGIGLYLAREIIGGEGGYIKVSSKVGWGQLFLFLFLLVLEIFQNC